MSGGRTKKRPSNGPIDYQSAHGTAARKVAQSLQSGPFQSGRGGSANRNFPHSTQHSSEGGLNEVSRGVPERNAISSARERHLNSKINNPCLGPHSSSSNLHKTSQEPRGGQSLAQSHTQSSYHQSSRRDGVNVYTYNRGIKTFDRDPPPREGTAEGANFRPASRANSKEQQKYLPAKQVAEISNRLFSGRKSYTSPRGTLSAAGVITSNVVSKQYSNSARGINSIFLSSILISRGI